MIEYRLGDVRDRLAEIPDGTIDLVVSSPPFLALRSSWRTGVVLDPFAGSGTTLEAAQIVGRHAIGIDLDARNADLARNRCGMFLEIVA